jgi:hypothetical protein
MIGWLLPDAAVQVVLSNLCHEMLYKHTWCHEVLAHITLLMSDRRRTLLLRARAHEAERHRGRMDVDVKVMNVEFPRQSVDCHLLEMCVMEYCASRTP